MNKLSLSFTVGSVFKMRADPVLQRSSLVCQSLEKLCPGALWDVEMRLAFGEKCDGPNRIWWMRVAALVKCFYLL